MAGSPGRTGTTGKRSAGLLLYRRAAAGTEVLLGHMGGPLWEHRDARAWSVPKGEYVPPEEAWDAARREFTEELGMPPPAGPYRPLGDIRQASGKVVTVWAVEGDLDPRRIVPGTFEMEWPRGSGVTATFPEIDRVAWFPPQEARERLVAGQQAFLDRLAGQLADGDRAAGDQ
ncbi:NUDIX domain-containing protein [Streptomyces kronopolitis]|uniref:NUDIX domain-containing protein n=1 Tax=Streptomyces kronopolitis TaxID=1612435 RepID=UPI0036CB7987